MRTLFPFLKPYRLQLVIGPFFKLSEAVLEILIPTLMALLIDNGVNRGDTGYILKIGALMLVIATCGVIFAYICQYSASIASQGFGTDVRNALFRHINTFSYPQLDRFGTSSLINRLTGDVNQLQSAVAMLIRLVIRAPFLCVGGLIMAMILDVKLSIIFMIVIPLFVVVLILVMTKAVPLYQSVQKKLDHLALVLRENLSGIRVIRAFARTDHERKRFSESNASYADTAIHVGKIAALTNPVTTIIMNLAILAVIWFGGLRVNTGNMTQGQIIAFINYITQILNAMIIVANLVVLYTRAYASAKRVGEVFGVTPDMSDGRESQKEKHTLPCVSFNHVSLRYAGTSENALSDITFHASKGEIIGIIGGTGSGKSSLISLIPRFYDATEGTVSLYGRDVRDYPQTVLRDKIGIVPQRAVLFSGTVSENLRFGEENATVQQLEQAASIAQASEFIDKLPYGYDTHLSQGGTNLSGGQRQRLTIARALVKQPDILILDDSSSALDYATDSRLRQAIREHTQDMTVFIVSQRVNSVRDADQILVLDDGCLVGAGTHRQLLNTCQVYQEICHSQAQTEEDARHE